MALLKDFGKFDNMKKNTVINFKSLLLATCMILTVQSSNAQIQKGADIDGEAAGDLSGFSVSMPDANTLAIGAQYNDGNGDYSGHVRVYSMGGLGVLENSVGNTLEIYPNPATSVINVKANIKLLGMAYSIYDNTGKLVQSGKITSENTSIDLDNLAAGIYVFSLTENMKQTFKVIGD